MDPQESGPGGWGEPPRRAPVTGRTRGAVITIDKFILGFSRRWGLFITLLAGLYAGLPFVAPVAQHYGVQPVADVLYTMYSPVCHQFAFRSWFLFGEQTVYPRERAGVSGVRSFEEYASEEPYFQDFFGGPVDPSILDNDLSFAAKQFRGSERMGYKVAFCQRDVAIYASIALFGIVFTLLRGAGVKIPYLPFWAYILIAIAPIGLDGFSQLFANPPFNGFGLGIYPIRESTPLLRVLTGSLFGLGNAWLAFPYIEESMLETRDMLEQKLAAAGVLAPRAEDSSAGA